MQEIFLDNLVWNIEEEHKTLEIEELVGDHPYNLGYRKMEIIIDPDFISLQHDFNSQKATLFLSETVPTFKKSEDEDGKMVDPNADHTYSYRIIYDSAKGSFTIDNATHKRTDETGKVFPEARRNISSIRLI